jgi:type 1 fimbria pilin
MNQLNVLMALMVAATLSGSTLLAHDGAAGEEVTVTGEVVDMVCYIDHGASGTEHADCAQKCIEMGLPVGLKTSDGKTYFLIGEHEPMNAALAPLAAKTITVKGKAVSRDGFNMIENAEIVKN